MKKIYMFSHTDLDGIGVIILGKKYAKQVGLPLEFHRCNYHEIDTCVNAVLDTVSVEEISEIMIGDISVNEETAERLDKLNSLGVPIRLRDHHATADWLNKYSWAQVREKDEAGVERCGTYWWAQEHDFQKILEDNKVFIEEVNSWDTWAWKEKDDNYAVQLNSLYQILGKIDFVDYIMDLPEGITEPQELFNAYGSTLIEAHNRQVVKTANNCMNSMWVTSLEVEHNRTLYEYRTGVVFCNADISEVADLILDEHPELDILMLVGLPRNISLRTQKTLDVPMGDLANILTGAGGGHPMAAGCVISVAQFRKIFTKFMASVNTKAVSVIKLNAPEKR